MLEAATEHMGARQQAYSDQHLFQHFVFTLHHSDTQFSFYSSVQAYHLPVLHQIKKRGKGAVFQYQYLSLKLQLIPWVVQI